jgi:hypothetical protein
MSDEDLEQRAAELWNGTGLADDYPRPIEQAIALKLPVTVVKLPAVTVGAVGRWLRRHHRAPVFPADRRDLMGCLYADGGHGFIFLSGADGPQEQRFTLAHDAAHFLVDYWWPRGQVLRALGPVALDVLDGRRPALPSERASAILAHVRVGPHWHLLPRPGAGPDGGARLARVEDRADELGLELVAPRRQVLRLLPTLPPGDLGAACAGLGSFFGLPAYVFGPLVAEQLRPRALTFLEAARRALGR